MLDGYYAKIGLPFRPTNVPSNENELRSRQGLLATYLIPGCFGRGVRLGSESSSGAGVGGVWKSGNLEIWEFGDLEIQKF